MKLAFAALAFALASAGLALAVVVPALALLSNRRRALRGEDGRVSIVPILGSILGSLAVVLAPIGTLRDRVAWSWVPWAAEAAVLAAGAAYWRFRR